MRTGKQWLCSGALVLLILFPSYSYGTQSSASSGKDLFESYCSTCHSTGDKSAIGPGLQHVMKRRTELYVRKQILNGKNAMPAFKDQLKKKEINELIKFLKTL